MMAGFSGGQYGLWRIRGSVEIDIQPQLMNAVLGGVFLDANPQQPLFLNWLNYGAVLRGPPGQTFRLNFSNDLQAWTPLTTNSVPDSGILVMRGLNQKEVEAGFYQAELLPDVLTSP
jgi:hypothetical protein